MWSIHRPWVLSTAWLWIYCKDKRWRHWFTSLFPACRLFKHKLYLSSYSLTFKFCFLRNRSARKKQEGERRNCREAFAVQTRGKWQSWISRKGHRTALDQTSVRNREDSVLTVFCKEYSWNVSFCFCNTYWGADVPEKWLTPGSRDVSHEDPLDWRPNRARTEAIISQTHLNQDS